MLKLVDALEREALDVFRLGRQLEREAWTDPKKLKQYGRSEIVARLREKFASEHVGLANTDALDVQLDSLPQHWYRQGGLLLDCAEALNIHVAVYEYELERLRREADQRTARTSSSGRAPSVAHDYLAAEQQRWDRTDDQVTMSLVEVGFIPSRETFVATFKENVIKKHRLRWLERHRND